MTAEIRLFITIWWMYSRCDLSRKVRQRVINEIYRDTSQRIKGWFPLGLPISHDIVKTLELSEQYGSGGDVEAQLAMVGVRARAVHLTTLSDVEIFGAAVLYNVYRYMLGVWGNGGTLELESIVARAQVQVSAQGFDEAKQHFSSKYPPQTDFDSSLRFVCETLLLKMALRNPALQPLAPLFGITEIRSNTRTPLFGHSTCAIFLDEDINNHEIYQRLMEPIVDGPSDLKVQLRSASELWGTELPESIRETILYTLDVLNEAQMPRGAPEAVFRQQPLTYSHQQESAQGASLEPNFTPDRGWMTDVVLIAKQTYVWLAQLSRQYDRQIERLDQIPDAELERLSELGFTGLWLIGLWSRSAASRTIKVRMGNPDAIASAYALDEYAIADELGGTSAYETLSRRALKCGIRLAADMVANHVGIDGKWLREHPDRFIQSTESPYENYRFDGPDLCQDPMVSVFLEDGYYRQSDAAVVFKRVDNSTGDVRYIYHGNDGTQMPWNDTAQLDYLNPQVRELVIQEILAVARRFPIIRFDAAMTLAKKHIQRLWYPPAGHGGAIPSRAALGGCTESEFEAAIPQEFWREVVDRINTELPDTLLLAEAFWMMEGYFVRSLGMHRVYNSAFMNMLKGEHNADYRTTIKNTLAFSPEVLKRFVNFMNNPDEETAVAQFGKGSKYIGNVIMMVTMPGLPMFGHGQIEGFEEKYGMEYQRPRWDECIDRTLVEHHERFVAPLMHQRHLFSGTANFELYDFLTEQGQVDENVFAYSNRCEEEGALVIFNNSQRPTSGYVSFAVTKKADEIDEHQLACTLDQALDIESNALTYYSCEDLLTGTQHIYRGCDFKPGARLYRMQGYQVVVLRGFTQLKGPAQALEQLYARYKSSGVSDLDHALRLLELGDGHETWRRFVDEALTGTLSAVSLAALNGDVRFNGLVRAQWDFSALMTGSKLDPTEVVSAISATVNRPQNKAPDQSDRNDDGSAYAVRDAVRASTIYASLTEAGTALLGDDLTREVVTSLRHAVPALAKCLHHDFRHGVVWYFECLEVCDAIGMHLHDGVSWFNQEEMETLLNLIEFSGFFEPLQSGRPNLINQVRQIAQDSAYRYTDFLFLLRRI
jgi:glycosidase